ncbi:YggS family pyridoxal phosphate-dependent enzyme [Candidatus Woesearchaeota archaeon]|nr:YggS family pyridoxal phosphate-dependent enzyme [Candidatus Woesearchaeota archaeon]
MGIREKAKKIIASVPRNVKILAATKGRSREEINEAINAGIRIIGENYVQEAASKCAGINAELHLIGHLQTNKAKNAVEIFDMIQSIDSFRIANEVQKECEKAGKKMNVLIEVNIGMEKSKSGCMPSEVMQLAEKIAGMPNLRLKGLMVVSPDAEEDVDRKYYKISKKVFDDLGKSHKGIETLSMGMSNSFMAAIEEGSNMIRLGRAIFG